MIALQITATTPHGIVLSRPWGVAFDGLLASVVWERRKVAAREAGEHFVYQPDGPQEVLPLPLARCGDPERDADWHWMATFADLHPRIQAVTEPDIRWRTSRTDHRRLQQLAPVISRQVSDTSGRYQRRVVPVTARPATHLTWRAVGDPDAIRELLTDLRSIGKNKGSGDGVVTRWEVTETLMSTTGPPATSTSPASWAAPPHRDAWTTSRPTPAPWAPVLSGRPICIPRAAPRPSSRRGETLLLPLAFPSPPCPVRPLRQHPGLVGGRRHVDATVGYGCRWLVRGRGAGDLPK